MPRAKKKKIIGLRNQNTDWMDIFNPLEGVSGGEGDDDLEMEGMTLESLARENPSLSNPFAEAGIALAPAPEVESLGKIKQRHKKEWKIVRTRIVQLEQQKRGKKLKNSLEGKERKKYFQNLIRAVKLELKQRHESELQAKEKQIEAAAENES